MVLTERFQFTGATGHMLAARLEHPDRRPDGYAVFVNCFTCTKDLKSIRWIAESLAETGVAVLRFDFTGLGESEGSFIDTDFSSNLEDILAAAGFLRDHYEAPRLLVGHSLGGTAVLAVADELPELDAVATISSPSDTQELRNLLRQRAPELERGGEAEVDIAGRPFRVRGDLLHDLDSHRVPERIKDLHLPLMVFHSPEDRTVPFEHALRIFNLAPGPKSLISLDGADHLLLNEDDARFVGRMLGTWAVRCMRDRAAAAPADSPSG